MSRVVASDEAFDTQVPLVIVGAGAAGLCAALAAKEAGADPVVIERDAVPSGSTGLSAGLIPAAGTRFQRAKGIDDTPSLFAGDIQRKAHGENDAAMVELIATNAGPTIEWLADRYGFPFDIIDNFNYPGHSAFRMHGLPTRTGAELIDRLRAAAEASGVTVLTGSRVETLFAGTDGRIRGVELVRGDGGHERIGCDVLVLACNGYGGNLTLVRELIPAMADALYFGHAGNQGEAVLWGRALGAELVHLGAYQGHGSVATPHNILITWAVIMEGGIQVNAQGRRFCDESRGYSEQAAEVLQQPGGIAWNVFDDRIADVARQFEDFRNAEKGGAVLTAASLDDLAGRMHVPAAALTEEWREAERCGTSGATDRFGRSFGAAHDVVPPWHAVKVTGALFHTQGGLAVDASARVKRRDGGVFPNLCAAGGAAAGVSGETASGYLSGNGLLAATVLGRLAGLAAAHHVSAVGSIKSRSDADAAD
jgi:fumarate reductase flavoprotein subunit